MSRRKDRDRYEAMRGLDPDYRGFRGHGNEPSRPGKAPRATAVCAICGRKRNVPVGVALEQGGDFVCASCAEEGGAPGSSEEKAGALA
jgi:hypothetical protein